jgi:hypothetical protein
MSIAGRWALTMKTPMGDQHSMLQVKIKRGVVSAIMTDAAGEGKSIQNATLLDGKLTFTIEVPTPIKIKLRFEVEANEDALAGTYRPGIFPAFAVEGVRLK